jgi:hypothetical protein
MPTNATDRLLMLLLALVLVLLLLLLLEARLANPLSTFAALPPGMLQEGSGHRGSYLRGPSLPDWQL